MNEDTIITNADVEASEATGAEKKNNSEAETRMDSIVKAMAEAVASTVINQRSGKSTCEDVKAVLNTVCVMNQADEFDVGIRVKGQLYRFDEYLAPAGIAAMVRPAKVCVTDVPTSVDFKDRKAYAVSGRVLDPAEFRLACKNIAKNIRSNPNSQPISRSPIGLLADETRYVVVNKRVRERDQDAISFITMRVDDEADVSIFEWAKVRAITLFD
jgi:hypothetical protein